MSESVLQVQDLSVWWGPAQAVFGVSLELRSGEAVALLGRNGAGKSSLLMALAGWTRHAATQLDIQGLDARTWPAHRRARAGLALVPQDRRIFTDLTVLENLRMGLHARGPRPEGTPRFELEEVLDLFSALKPRLGHWGSELSGGEQQMLAIARALLSHPTAMLMDEPTEGLAPKIIDNLQTALASLRHKGLSVLLAEQHQRFAMALCSRALVLHEGRLMDASHAQDLGLDGQL
ncbi:MAG: hypothetical protein RL111_2059 [Pseudomonadota bacterium]|jgi:branched-chain amino acid transport system ATP-binding protein